MDTNGTVTILGATGRTGVPLVKRALEQGHAVRALVRSSGKAASVLPASDRLHLVQGDLTDADAVAQAVAGADAVIDVSGPVKGGPGDLRERAAGLLIPAMRSAGVKRLIGLTGAGVRVDGDEPNVVDKLIRGIMSVVAADRLKDGSAYVEAVHGSGLDWTIVRAPRLTDGAAKGDVMSRPHLGRGTTTSLGREDLATYLLSLVDDGSSVGTNPVVSRPS